MKVSLAQKYEVSSQPQAQNPKQRMVFIFLIICSISCNYFSFLKKKKNYKLAETLNFMVVNIFGQMDMLQNQFTLSLGEREREIANEPN
jgi:hypothetical protein